MDIRQVISERIREMRIMKGLTQQELADIVRMDVRYVSRLESQAPNLTIDLLERLAKGLGCHPAELLGDARTTVSPLVVRSLDRAIESLTSFRSAITVKRKP